MRKMKIVVAMLCLLAIILPVFAAAEEAVVNTVVELQEFLTESRAAGSVEVKVTCTPELFEEISAEDFAGLYRICYMSGLSDFRLRYSSSGMLQFQSVVYQDVLAVAECDTEEEVRAAVGGFLQDGASSMTLMLNADLFQKLYSQGEMYRVMAELGVENFSLKGNAQNICFVSNLTRMDVPYAKVGSLSEAGDKIAAWREERVEAFNLIFDSEVYQALTHEDYRLLSFLGGAEQYSMSYSNAASMLLFSEVVYTDIPGAYCTSEEEIVSAIRAMGARGNATFQIKMDEKTYQDVSANSFERMNALQVEAGMSGGDLLYSGVGCLVQFENAVVQADVVPFATLAEVTVHVEECAARGDENISMLIDADVYNDLMEGMNSLFASDAKIYDLIANAGIFGAEDYSFNRNMGAVNLNGVHYFAGWNILRAFENSNTDGLTNRELQALSAAEKLAEECARDSQTATALAIHDALCEMIVYTDDESTDEDDCCIGALLNGQANCDGYADAMMLVGRLAGLNVRYQHGDSSKDGISGLFSTHMWNMVELDGSWRLFDLTWDDSENGIGYQWFNIGEDRAALSHVWSHEMSVPLLAETPLENRPVTEYFVSSEAEVTAAVAAAEAAGIMEFDLYVSAESGLSMIATRQAVQQGAQNSLYYTWIEGLGCMHVQFVA